MSIILDALRRGRGRQTPRLNSNAAQTDAVLQTLGYGRFNPTSPFNRLKRVALYLALAVVVAIGLWGAVIWITQAFLAPPAAPEIAAARPQEPASTPKPTPAPSTTAARPAPEPPVTTAPPVVTAPPVATAPPAMTVPPPARARESAPIASTSAPGGATVDKPSAPNLVVQPSQRVSIPDSVPSAPTGAPSRTAVSPAAGASVATVTTGDDHFGRGMMYQRLGDFENALVSYRQVLQRDDLNVEAHNNLGVLYRDKGLFDDAIRHFQRAIAINPGYARARNNLGVVFLTQRKLDAAATQFHAALGIDPKNVESMVNLSTVEKELGRRDDARPWLMRALQAEPRNAEAHYNLGLLEDEAGDRTKALVHYRAFLQYGAAVHPTLAGEVRARIQKLEGD